MDYDKILTKIIFIDGNTKEKSRRLTSISTRLSKNKSKYRNILNYLWNKYPDSGCLRELYFRLKYNVRVRPVCPICGSKLTFCGHIDSDILYSPHCSKSCARKDKSVIKKSVQTGELKYGKGNSTNRDKAKQTCIETFGVDNPWKIKSVQQKCVDTKSKNGTLYVKDKIETTNLSKYGVRQVLQSKEVRDKGTQTCIVKYGVTHPMKAKEVKDKYDWISVIDKITAAKKRNGTFRNTRPEREIYSVLSTIFEVKREYKDKLRYPFNCDFYIPELDLFIEYNGTWTHGRHRYTGSEEDLKQLELWKSKNSEYYNNAINTWTVRDIAKFETAERNNLNYLAFYNLEQFYEWFNSL